jgi:hypothetical protein
MIFVSREREGPPEPGESPAEIRRAPTERRPPETAAQEIYADHIQDVNMNVIE